MPVGINVFENGSLVRLKASFLGEPIGTLCYIYERYQIGREPGVSLITENGVDLGGFSFDEQSKYLEYAGYTFHVYDFKSVIYLSIDFRNGYFNDVFTNPKYRKTLKTK